MLESADYMLSLRAAYPLGALATSTYNLLQDGKSANRREAAHLAHRTLRPAGKLRGAAGAPARAGSWFTERLLQKDKLSIRRRADAGAAAGQRWAVRRSPSSRSGSGLPSHIAYFAWSS